MNPRLKFIQSELVRQHNLASYFLIHGNKNTSSKFFFMAGSKILYIHDRRKYNGVLSVIGVNVLKAGQVPLRTLKLRRSWTSSQITSFLEHYNLS